MSPSTPTCEAEARARPTADLLVAEACRLGRAIDPAVVERNGIDAGLRERAAEIGLFGLTLPEQHGGAGLSLGAACRVVEELAVSDRALATSVGLHAGLGTRAIVDLGSDALRARLLPRMARGELIGAFAATEPEAGSDLAGVRTFAVPVGDALRLTGEKAYVTNGGFAGVFTVLCRTPRSGTRPFGGCSSTHLYRRAP
jgi:alkylation response protein AidB-like acyl-CoA dehydrogenase